MNAQELAEAIRSAMDLMTTPAHNRPTYIDPEVGYSSTDAAFNVNLGDRKFCVSVSEYEPDEDYE